jgi:hypothetical protein
MSLSDRLDEMRAGIAGCSLVSFGDLQTSLALRTSSAAPCPRERLDEIFAQAAAGFAAADRLVADAEPVGDLFVLTPSDVRVFVRSLRNAADVVCAVGETTDEIGTMTARAKLILDDAERTS